MKKLSELSMDTMLCVCLPESSDYFNLMEKAEFLQRNCEPESIFIAEAEVATFDWRVAIEWLEEDMHEDWTELVMNEIMATPELMAAEKLVNEMMRSHPTYYPGERVENDMRGKEI